MKLLPKYGDFKRHPIISFFFVLTIIALLIAGGWYYNKQKKLERQRIIFFKDGRIRIILSKDFDSRYHLTGKINGVHVKILIDESINTMAIPIEIAKKAKLKQEIKAEVKTSAKSEYAYFTTIKSIKIGPIAFSNVGAFIYPNRKPDTVLIGSDILKRFNIKRSNYSLTLTYSSGRARN